MKFNNINDLAEVLAEDFEDIQFKEDYLLLPIEDVSHLIEWLQNNETTNVELNFGELDKVKVWIS